MKRVQDSLVAAMYSLAKTIWLFLHMWQREQLLHCPNHVPMQKAVYMCTFS